MASVQVRSWARALPAVLIAGLTCPSATLAAALPPPPVSPAPVVQFEYDAEGHPAKTVQAPGVPGKGFEHELRYDSLGRPRFRIDALAGQTELQHDGLDRLVEVRDPRQLRTLYELNGLGDQRRLQSPDTGTATSDYDAAGNLKSRSDARGFISNYSYDALNRLTIRRISHPSDGSSRVLGWSYDQSGEAYGYGAGRLTSASTPEVLSQLKYDALGRLIGQAWDFRQQGRYELGYGYDGADRITQIRYPSGRVVSYSYLDGQPQAISIAASETAGSQPLISGIESSPFGPARRWHWVRAGGQSQLHERVFDAYGRLVRQQLGPLIRDLRYDEADRIVSYIHYDAATAAPLAQYDQYFGYDALGRITELTVGGQSTLFAYDANGNRRSVDGPGGQRLYTIAADSNRLLALDSPVRSFSHDAVGNTLSEGNDGLAWQASYNHEGRLARLQVGSLVMQAAYDAFGQRVRRQIGTADVVYFAYDLHGQLLGEYTMKSGQMKPQIEYVWFEDQPVAALRSGSFGELEVFELHADHLGAPRFALDRQGRMRWRWLSEPFGVMPAEINPAGLGALNISLRLPGQQNVNRPGFSRHLRASN